jgi:hypothetical protein
MAHDYSHRNGHRSTRMEFVSSSVQSKWETMAMQEVTYLKLYPEDVHGYFSYQLRKLFSQISAL